MLLICSSPPAILSPLTTADECGQPPDILRQPSILHCLLHWWKIAEVAFPYDGLHSKNTVVLFRPCFCSPSFCVCVSLSVWVCLSLSFFRLVPFLPCPFLNVHQWNCDSGWILGGPCLWGFCLSPSCKMTSKALPVAHYRTTGNAGSCCFKRSPVPSFLLQRIIFYL